MKSEAKETEMNNLTLGPAQIEHFDNEGYLVRENLFSAAEVKRVLEIAHVDPQLKANTKSNNNFGDDQEGPVTILANRPILASDAYSCLARSRRVVETIEQLLRDEVFHFYHLIMQKDPGTGGWQYHQDYGYHYNEFFYPSFCSVMLALDPATHNNGCLRVVKDSNQLGRLEHQSSGSQRIADPQRVELALAAMDEIHCELQPGSALYFHGNILHASDPNLSKHPRWALIYAFAAAQNTVVLPEVEKALGPPIAGWSDEQVAAATQRHWEEIQAQLA